jgi:hypothetical protein
MVRDNIRVRALERIAALSASSADRTDLERLSKACSTHPTGKARDYSNGHYSTQGPTLGRVPMVGPASVECERVLHDDDTKSNH